MHPNCFYWWVCRLIFFPTPYSSLCMSAFRACVTNNFDIGSLFDVEYWDQKFSIKTLVCWKLTCFFNFDHETSSKFNSKYLNLNLLIFITLIYFTNYLEFLRYSVLTDQCMEIYSTSLVWSGVTLIVTRSTPNI